MMIKKKAQHFGELALLFALVVLSISAMQLYVKRGLQARMRAGIDAGVTIAQNAIADSDFVLDEEIDSADDGTILTQYEPYYKDEFVSFESANAGKEQNIAGDKFAHESWSRSRLTQYGVSRFNSTTDDVW